MYISKHTALILMELGLANLVDYGRYTFTHGVLVNTYTYGILDNNCVYLIK